MPTPHRIIEVLDRLRDYLSQALAHGALVLIDDDADGRLNSQANERQISVALRLYAHSNEWFQANGLTIDVAEPRFWYDFCARGPHGLFVPVNVKVSAFQTRDNVSSKMGLFYALTGVDPHTVKLNSWDQFFKNLAEYLGQDQSADYYFIAVNKTAPGDVIWTGLKLLQSLSPNGSNPPYQCKWGNNRVQVERTFDEASNLILSVVRESLYRGANSLVSFDRHLSAPPTTTEWAMTDQPPKETASYRDAVQALSQLSFETESLDDEIPPLVDAAITMVARLYQRDDLTVLEDLREQRVEEQNELNADHELLYGHLNEYGETPEEAAQTD